MLADPRVKCVAIIHEDTIGSVDRFLIVATPAIRRSEDSDQPPTRSIGGNILGATLGGLSATASTPSGACKSA